MEKARETYQKLLKAQPVIDWSKLAEYEAGEDFTEAGGTHFAYIPCLNTQPAHLDMLETLVRRELSGWYPLHGADEARIS